MTQNYSLALYLAQDLFWHRLCIVWLKCRRFCCQQKWQETNYYCICFCQKKKNHCLLEEMCSGAPEICHMGGQCRITLFWVWLYKRELHFTSCSVYMVCHMWTPFNYVYLWKTMAWILTKSPYIVQLKELLNLQKTNLQ